MDFANGAKYDGLWESGLMFGKGKYTYPEDSPFDKYEGHFAHDMRDGEGVMKWKKEQKEVEYSGMWREDKRYGKGEMTAKDDKGKKKKVKGEWKDDALVQDQDGKN